MKTIYIKKIFLLVLSISFFTSCSRSSSGGGDDTPPPMIPSPSASTLIFPEDDTECNTGAVVSDTKSNVTFEWNTSKNTDTYEINLTNLNTSNFLRTSVSTNEITLLIERGTPYEWFVISKANGTNETATSQTWRFFNEGPGIENYAPFPAEAINPTRGANIASTTSITLEWDASDVDEDITTYEVLFGTEVTPSISLGSTSEKSIENVGISGNTTYYWQVITTDSNGNTSNSEIFEFKVQ
ncbi:hypothetical protein MTsPCn9_20450 [Croceitalea sp. MTPC9]|uniref:hypothetical protein n=1 Tax=unclassified Croceitalea TaxID=2632280 RepID=UPI002B3B37A5|nr:hypothetical protein MTsPCn6_25810 [Croceitalea sp. MTPC6]GMN17109.1 hypothetical protein MTsPCn9_20450 [Croceitalea sp. MTPC9]